MRRKPGQLSPDDKAVWDQVTRTLRPIHSATSPAPVDPAPKPVRRAAPVIAPVVAEIAPRPVTTRRTSVQMSPDPMAALEQQPVRMDNKAFGRMKRGRLAPDARIDLHGMTAARAHGALLSFIQQAHGQGLRLVLVITGKGQGARQDPDAMSDRKGVLRHAVPQWLGQAPVAGMVLQVSSAHQKHGGAGAYYVYLKRRR